MKNYCTQNNGDCGTCSLVNYNRDCHNNPLGLVGDCAACAIVADMTCENWDCLSWHTRQGRQEA